jgi:integrase
MVMASLYYRGDAIWINYKGEDGRWHSKTTGYRKSNPGERRQAELLRDKQTLRERTERPTVHAAGWDWVDSWVESRWGSSEATTPKLYRSEWKTLQKWLVEIEVKGPATLRREQCQQYPQWRKKNNAEQNTAIGELKFLGQVMKEAVTRQLAQSNPAAALGLKKASPKENRTWTDKELAKVDAALLAQDKFGWMRVTFLLGRYQAARIGSCAVPLDCIDFKLKPKTIFYGDPKGGTEKAFSQPIDPRLVPALAEIVKYRRSIGALTLCDIPDPDNNEIPPGVRWRRFLDSLGIKGVSHHDLRRTWITKAAISGRISESLACKFTNHSSLAVHRIYQKFSTEDMAEMLTRLQ